MKALCSHPISTGIMDRKPTYDPCGREVHKGLDVCIHHARDLGLVPREMSGAAVTAAMAAAKRADEAALSNADVAARLAEKKAKAADVIAEIRRLRKAARDRRIQDEHRSMRRRNKPPVRLDD